MITPSHLIYSWALAMRTKKAALDGPAKHRTATFVVGALLPDIPVYVFFLVCGVLLGYGHEQLWDDMYFNSGWSVAFTLSHSLLLWPLLYLLAKYKRWFIAQWVAISAIFHIVVDFCVHTADAYAHFWPLTDWRFVSPISYWDRASYGQYVGCFDAALVLGLLWWLATRYRESKLRFLVYGLIVLAALRFGLEWYNLIKYA